VDQDAALELDGKILLNKGLDGQKILRALCISGSDGPFSADSWYNTCGELFTDNSLLVADRGPHQGGEQMQAKCFVLSQRLGLGVFLAALLVALLPYGTAVSAPPSPPTIYIEPNGWTLTLSSRISRSEDASPDTTLTLGFCPDYDAAYHAYIQGWFAAVYPAIVAILGEPYESDHACLCPIGYAGWPPECDRIIVGAYPNITLPYDPANPTDALWEDSMTHEFIHVHHGSVTPSYCTGSHCYGDWVEEGLTEASTGLVVQYAYAQGIRDMITSSWDPAKGTRRHDVAALAGVEFWGGSPVPARKVEPLESYHLVATLFWMVATSQNNASGEIVAGDWINYDWFRRLNGVIYAWQHAHPHAHMSHDQFYQFVDQLSPLPIDGQTASAWMQAQPITHYGNPAGNYMGAFPARPYVYWWSIEIEPVNPYVIRLAFYTLDTADPANESVYTGEVNGTYAVYDHENNLVDSDSFSTTTGVYDIWNSCSLGDGAYRVEAQADVGGVQHTAHTVYLCAPTDVADAASGVGFILTEPDGTLFDGSATSRSGALSFNAGAGAILQPGDLSLLPLTVGLGFQPTLDLEPSPPLTSSHTIYLPAVCRDWPPPDVQFYNLPLPFSRVIVAIKPDR
jgi:hypothetical protein